MILTSLALITLVEFPLKYIPVPLPLIFILSAVMVRFPFLPALIPLTPVKLRSCSVSIFVVPEPVEIPGLAVTVVSSVRSISPESVSEIVAELAERGEKTKAERIAVESSVRFNVCLVRHLCGGGVYTPYYYLFQFKLIRI